MVVEMKKLRLLVPVCIKQEKYIEDTEGNLCKEILKTRLNMQLLQENYKNVNYNTQYSPHCSNGKDTTEHAINCEVVGENI